MLLWHVEGTKLGLGIQLRGTVLLWHVENNKFSPQYSTVVMLMRQKHDHLMCEVKILVEEEENMKGIRGRGERVEATLKNYRNPSSTTVLLNWNNSHIDFFFLKTMSHN